MSTVHVTRDTFQAEVLDSDLPVVVDLWAPWCGPCRALGPVLEELAEEYAGKVKVVKINTDEEPELAGAFQVRSIPMVAALRGNKVVDVQVGFGGRAPLQAMFERLVSGEDGAEA